MKTLKFKIVLFCLMATAAFSQQKLSKVSKSINANSDVTIDLNTSYAEIEIETWNKNTVEVEAYIESSKLSKAELQKALERWNLEVSGSGDYISISSKGGKALAYFSGGDYSDVLRDLEIHLADIPELPELPEMPAFPKLPKMDKMPAFPGLPEMPELPNFPELPELPEGVNSIKFDYDEYKKDGEAYLDRWSEEYEREHGKEFKEKMKEWGRKFGESDYRAKMEKWGEDFGKRFEGQWAEDMEAWGESFGEEFGEKFGKDWAKKMEKWGENLEDSWGKDWEERVEAWGERLGKQMERKADLIERKSERAEARAEREEHIRERLEERSEMKRERAKELAERSRQRKEAVLRSRLDSRGNTKVKKVIKIKMPKKTNLKMNVRHGELKFSSVIYNLKGDISHSSLVAEHIDGSDTSINVSYSPVLISNWNVGELKLNFVDDAQITTTNQMMLSSNSSNIIINTLKGNAIIDGSFGDLTIANIANTFKNLNITLENSDAIVNLPRTDYSLLFRGERSRFNDKLTTKKIINNHPEDKDSNKTIVVNAKYSSVVMQ